VKAIRLCWFSDESGNSAEDGRGGRRRRRRRRRRFRSGCR